MRPTSGANRHGSNVHCGLRFARVTASLLLCIACRSSSRSGLDPSPGMLRSEFADAAQIVREYVGAFNRHDVAGIMHLADPEVSWLSLAGDSLHVETSGVTALQRELASYFGSNPTVRSTLGPLAINGPFVATRETVRWSRDGVERSQSSLSVYEIRGGRVRRVWYYPVVAPAK
jgi:hypothetical protein